MTGSPGLCNEFFLSGSRSGSILFSETPDVKYDILCSDMKILKLINDSFGIAINDRLLTGNPGFVRRAWGIVEYADA